MPEDCFPSVQDLKEQIAGPNKAHFQHILKKYQGVDLRIEGQPSTAAPPAHRLHVLLSSEDGETFESASADVLDLVETVCDMVGEELGMPEERVEQVIQSIRTEKYSEAQGVRTPLPPGVRTPVPGVRTPVPSTFMPPVSKPAKNAQEQIVGDYEFVDEEAPEKMAKNEPGDDNEDAMTEASEALSDLTEGDPHEAKASAGGGGMNLEEMWGDGGMAPQPPQQQNWQQPPGVAPGYPGYR